MDGNGQSLARCIYNCEDDESCETDCVRQFKVKTDDCPCEVRKELCHNLWPIIQIRNYIIKGQLQIWMSM